MNKYRMLILDLSYYESFVESTYICFARALIFLHCR